MKVLIVITKKGIDTIINGPGNENLDLDQAKKNYQFFKNKSPFFFFYVIPKM
jgi:hypothetical protein